jgi:hypothetical protein
MSRLEELDRAASLDHADLLHLVATRAGQSGEGDARQKQARPVANWAIDPRSGRPVCKWRIG